MNGIPELAARPDLISRAVLITLPAIPDGRRRDEATLWAEFEQVRPQLLGAVDAMVSVALQREPLVTLATKPRMADFARWVVAAESACPWEAGAFVRVYAGNRANAEAAALDGDPVADLVRTLASETWTGTASDLLARLNAVTPETTQRHPSGFKRPRQVSDALRRIAPTLRQAGVEVTFVPRAGQRRLIQIWLLSDKAGCGASSASSASPMAGIAGVPGPVLYATPRIYAAASTPSGVRQRVLAKRADSAHRTRSLRVAFMPDGQQQEPGGWNRVVLHVTDLPACVESLKRVGVHFRNEMELGPGGKQIQVA